MSEYDVAVIGSGTSGSVLSYYLTKAGFKTVMIEAGKWYTAKDFPMNEMDYNGKMFWNGGMDINTKATLVFLRAKCVGGGSVVNQCLLDRFDDVALDDWREYSGVSFFTQSGMKPHYEEIEGQLSLQKIPREHWNKNAEIFVEGHEKLGFKWAQLRRGQTDCATDEGHDCIVCLGGCPRNSKQSMLVTFIPRAVEQGLEVKTEFEVKKIEATTENVTIYGERQGKPEKITATRCVVAAGSLGTTKIMLASGFKKSVPAVGEGFYCHPQIMNFGLYDEPIDAFKGMFQAVKSDDPKMRKMGFKLENVFAQPIGAAMLYPKYGKKHQEFMKNYRYYACIEVAVRDVSRGKMRLDKKGRLLIDKKLNKEDLRRAKAGIKVVKQIFSETGAKTSFYSPFWFGLHLMGGCSIGTDPKRSVVDETFRVHGFTNVYIADSSIFPLAPGINPALTIMALAHRASQVIAKEE